jgi:23S rRNA pseudouridine2604 synthase
MSIVSLNKYIADSGYCSRREADMLITQQRVTVNDMMGTIAMRVGPNDVIAVDFEIIKQIDKKDTIVLAYNKPAGLTCTTDLEDKSSILHFIKYPKRVFPIGRIDKDSSGLLLLTNDGDLVNKILRSGNNHEKEYWVSVYKPLTADFLKAMGAGVQLPGLGLTKPCKVKQLGPRKFSITLIQGLNRQIRKMCAVLQYKVTELQRVRIMNIYLGDMAQGKFRKLTDGENYDLQGQTKNSVKTSERGAKKYREKKAPKVAIEATENENIFDAKEKNTDKTAKNYFQQRKLGKRMNDEDADNEEGYTKPEKPRAKPSRYDNPAPKVAGKKSYAVKGKAGSKAFENELPRKGNKANAFKTKPKGAAAPTAKKSSDSKPPKTYKRK